MSRRSSTEAIHFLRRLMKLHRERKNDLHMVFIDLRKRISIWNCTEKEKMISIWNCIGKGNGISIWKYLEKKGVSVAYIQIIKDMHERVKTSIRTFEEDTNEFPVDIGLNQRSALNPFLFVCIQPSLSYLFSSFKSVLCCLMFRYSLPLNFSPPLCV